MRVTLIGLVAAVLLFGAATGGALAQEGEPPQAPPARPAAGRTPLTTEGAGADFDPNQPLRAGFQISVSVTSSGVQEQDLTGTFQVDPTGHIQMKLIGLVPLRGLTPAQAGDKITALLKPYLKDPKATVTILSIPKPTVFLGGALSQAEKGPREIDEDMTLSQLLTILPIEDNADLSKVRITSRDEKGNPVVKEYNLLRWLKPLPGEQPDQTQNPTLHDRDFVFVPLKALPGTGIAIVEGAVVRPGPFSLRVGVPTTLREALSASGGPITSPELAALGGGPTPAAAAPGGGGGPTQIADRKQVILRRFGVERPLVLDYDRAEAGDPAHDVVLRPDDIIYVQRLAEDQFINMNGGFINPGRKPYTKAMTLTQAIGDAGGIALNAKEHEGRVFRHVNGADPTKTQVIAFDYKKIRKNQAPDIMLEPGDTIEIPLAHPPRPPMDTLQLTASLLSIALLVDRLFGRGGRGGF